MSTLNQVDYSLLASEYEGGASPAMEAQKDFCVTGEVNSIAALEQLFTIHLSYDTAHVESLVTAFHRFTPATLLYIPEYYLDIFLVEMSPDTVLVYDAGADLRDVRAFFHVCPLPFYYPTESAVVETKYLQPWEPDGELSILLYEGKRRACRLLRPTLLGVQGLAWFWL